MTTRRDNVAYVSNLFSLRAAHERGMGFASHKGGSATLRVLGDTPKLVIDELSCIYVACGHRGDLKPAAFVALTCESGDVTAEAYYCDN